jgi:hypothetical protein
MSKQHNMLQISERSLSREEGREQQRSNNNKNKQTHPRSHSDQSLTHCPLSPPPISISFSFSL